MNPLENAEEMGKRLSAARGYMQLDRKKFAAEIDYSVPTIRRYETGEGLEGKSRLERREIAERYHRVTGCPATLLFGENIPASAQTEERLARMEKQLLALTDVINQKEK